MDALAIVFKALGTVVRFFVDRTLEAGIETTPLAIVLALLGATAWLGTACWAGSIAVMRRHSGPLHFVVALLLPVVYPVVLLFAMDVKGARRRMAEMQTAATTEADDSLGALTERAAGVDDDVAAAAEVPVALFDEAYFRRLLIDHGADAHWSIVFDGVHVQVEGIAEILSHAIVADVRDEEGTAQRIRIPYVKMTSCEPA